MSEAEWSDLTPRPPSWAPRFPKGKGSSGPLTLADHRAPLSLGDSERGQVPAGPGRGLDRGLQTSDIGLVTFLLFGLGKYTLALPLSAVTSIERPGRFTAVPFAAPWLLGVTAVRGAVVSVVDLSRYAGLERAGRVPGARLLVASVGGVTAALLVDRLGKLAALPAQPGPAPSKGGPLSDCWSGAHTVDGEIVPLIDPVRLFGAPAFQSYQV